MSIACYPFALHSRLNAKPPSVLSQSDETNLLTHRDPVAQRQGDSLRFTPDTYVPSDSPSLCTLDAKIGQSVLT